MNYQVAIPTFNGVSTLRETLESVLSQTGVQKIHISDHGSQDGTLELLSALSSEDDRIHIHFLDQANSVWSNWRNAVLRCDSTFVKLMGQDDILTREGFEYEFDSIQSMRLNEYSFIATRPLFQIGTHQIRGSNRLEVGTITYEEFSKILTRSSVNPLGEPVGLLINRDVITDDVLMEWELEANYVIDLQLVLHMLRVSPGLYHTGPKHIFKPSPLSWSNQFKFDQVRDLNTLIEALEPNNEFFLRHARMLKNIARWVVRSIALSRLSHSILRRSNSH